MRDGNHGAGIRRFLGNGACLLILTGMLLPIVSGHHLQVTVEMTMDAANATVAKDCPNTYRASVPPSGLTCSTIVSPAGSTGKIGCGIQFDNAPSGMIRGATTGGGETRIQWHCIAVAGDFGGNIGLDSNEGASVDHVRGCFDPLDCQVITGASAPELGGGAPTDIDWESYIFYKAT